MVKPIILQLLDNGCMICTSHAKNEWGYTEVKRNGYRRLHRLVYEQNYGPIPENMLIEHTCDNPGCVNPAHLRLGTAKSNMQDKIKKGRDKKGFTKDQVAYILDLYYNVGMSKEAIAISMDTTEGTIRRILKKNEV